MMRPALLRILPRRLQEPAYFRRYHTRHHAWQHLFAKAPLAICPRVAMYDLIPGDVISGLIAFTGSFEWQLTQLMAQHAAKGGVLVDVGANMGYFSLIWAELNPAGKAIAFEASPRNVALLRNNVIQNGLEHRITVVPMAAGDRAGTATFDIGPAEQTGWGGLSAAPSSNTITVPMVRLDQHLADTEIDVLKIDVEGAETLVLSGCEGLLVNRKIKVIYFEQNSPRMKQLGIADGEALQFLKSFGYECRNLGNDGREWLAYPA